MTTVKVAAVQATPVFLDRAATIDRTTDLLAKAAADGAQLAVLPEGFVPGYPDWVWRAPAWNDHEWFARWQDQAVVVPGPDVERLGEAARAAGIYAAVGVNEREPGGSTIYNTILYFGPDGRLLAKHRKLMPTGGERLVWGYGDGSTLAVIDTPFGRVGGLICWENYMPLARAAMYAKSIDIWVAPTWDNSETWVSTLRHIAKEGRQFVIGVAPFMRGSDIPRTIKGADELYAGDEDFLSKGNATIVDPEGNILAGPLIGSEGIVTADIDVERARASRRKFDPVGHYSRPDVFRLTVDTRAKSPVVFEQPD
jgi:nitrilase